MTKPSAGRSGRPRDTSIDDRVLSATRELLMELGWDDLSVRGHVNFPLGWQIGSLVPGGHLRSKQDQRGDPFGRRKQVCSLGAA